MNNPKPMQTQPPTLPAELLQELSAEDLALIAGGKPKEDDDPIDSD